MRCAHRRADRTGRQRRATGKELGTDPVRRHAPSGQARPQVAEEAGWHANVEVAISRDAQLVEDLHAHATGRVVFTPLSITRGWLAVPDLTSPASKHPEKLSHLRGEGLGLAIACTVQPPDRSRRSARSQRMQHREYGRRTDSRTQEHHRPGARLQGEAASRFADIKDAARSNVAVQVVPRDAVWLHLDADAIVLVGGKSGE